MSRSGYQRLPTTDADVDFPLQGHTDNDDDNTTLIDTERAPYRLPTYPPDPRFHQPEPSSWARAGLLVFVVFLFWLAYESRKWGWDAAFGSEGAGGRSEETGWDF